MYWMYQSENLALLKEEAQMIDSDTLIRYIRIFSDLTNQLKYSDTEEGSAGSNPDQIMPSGNGSE